MIAYVVGIRLYNAWKSPVESHVSVKESSREPIGALPKTGARASTLKSGGEGSARVGSGASDRNNTAVNLNGQKTGQKDSKAQKGRENTTGAGGRPATNDPRQRKPKETYEIIAQKNLFSPNRNPIEEKEEIPEPEEVFDPNSELMVYGTFIIGDYKSALVKVSGGAEKQKATETTIGSNVARYRVTDINDEGIVVEDPKGRTYTLNCSKAKKERRDIRTAVPQRPGAQKEMAQRKPAQGDDGVRRSTPPVVDERRRVGRTRDERAAILSELRKRHLQKQKEPEVDVDEAPEPSNPEE